MDFSAQFNVEVGHLIGRKGLDYLQSTLSWIVMMKEMIHYFSSLRLGKYMRLSGETT